MTVVIGTMSDKQYSIFPCGSGRVNFVIDFEEMVNGVYPNFPQSQPKIKRAISQARRGD